MAALRRSALSWLKGSQRCTRWTERTPCAEALLLSLHSTFLPSLVTFSLTLAPRFCSRSLSFLSTEWVAKNSQEGSACQLKMSPRSSKSCSRINSFRCTSHLVLLASSKSASSKLTSRLSFRRHRRQELKEGAPKAQHRSYYYVDYSHATDVIKWRMYQIKQTVDVRLRNVRSTLSPLSCLLTNTLINT